MRAMAPQYPLLHLCGPGQGSLGSQIPSFLFLVCDEEWAVCFIYLYRPQSACPSPPECRGVGGPGVNATSLLCPNATNAQDSLVLWWVAAIGHITLLRSWGQYLQGFGHSLRSHCPSPIRTGAKSQQSKALLSGQTGGQQIGTSTADWNKHKGSEEEVSLPPQTRWRMSRS